jgi:hypothetical protein
MKSLIPLTVLAGACAACTAGPAPGARDEQALAAELAERVEGEGQRCIASSPSRALAYGDRRTILYREGRTLWVNRLDAECPGLGPHATLIVETNGSSYCHGDRVRALPSGSSIPSPTCILRDFVPYRKP